MEKKKIVRKEKKNKLEEMATADLYALYVFVSNDANRGFGSITKEANEIVSKARDELKEELYRRAYGRNPYKEFPVVIEGIKPEDVDLDRFVVYKEKKGER